MHIQLGDVAQCQGYLKSQDNPGASSLTTILPKDSLGVGLGKNFYMKINKGSTNHNTKSHKIF